jgi:hypothetical protein
MVDRRDRRAANRCGAGRDLGTDLLRILPLDVEARLAKGIGISRVSRRAAGVVGIGGSDIDELRQQHAVAFGGRGTGLDLGAQGSQSPPRGGVSCFGQGGFGALHALERGGPAGGVFGLSRA